MQSRAWARIRFFRPFVLLGQTELTLPAHHANVGVRGESRYHHQVPGRVAIIDDDERFTLSLKQELSRSGLEVCGTASLGDAHVFLAEHSPELVIADVLNHDGLMLIDEVQTAHPGASIIIATACADVAVAVEAMKRGATDFISKGQGGNQGLAPLKRRVEQLLERHLSAFPPPRTARAEPFGLIGESPVMKALKLRLEALTSSDDTIVFVAGETGTGKGVVARSIHKSSGRASAPFVAVDCTTIPSTLVESELFGHERGAFSGAVQGKIGRVEAAGNGTLFLDEIGELELHVQAKLLRLLEEKEFTRVGSTKTRHLHARIVAATNRRLSRAVDEGRFRADLRYRLEVFVVELPPLRKRGDDLFLLASHFIRERSRTLGRREPTLHADVISALLRYPFPGNVRELRNMIEQATLLSTEGELTLEAFPVLKHFLERPKRVGQPSLTPPPADRRRVSESLNAAPREYRLRNGRLSSLPPPLNQETLAESSLSDIRAQWAKEEQERIVRALQSTGGNISAAARKLELSRYQLLRRLKKYKL